jgi:outer membrane lipoprotein LolB
VRAPGQFDPQTRNWTGRLALQVQDNQSQSFSAGFELRGKPQAGELTLFTPLGGVAAALSWEPGGATLKNGAQVRRFESVDAVVVEATGSAIPVAALFDWLEGRNTAVPGWQADLSELGHGRLRAQRMQPPPAADLRVVLDR